MQEVPREELVRRIGQVRVLIQAAVQDLRRAHRQYRRDRDGHNGGGVPRGKTRLGVLAACGLAGCRWTSAASERKKDADLIERAVSLSDAEIARLLRANDLDPQVACNQALQQLFWRRDHGVDALLGSSAEFEAQDKRGFLYWAGKDLDGRPVLTVCLRRHDPQLFSAETTLRFILWKIESKLADHNVEDITLLLDLENASRHNLDSKLLRELVPLLYNFYSGRLAKVLFYPDSSLSQSVWRTWSYLLRQDTLRKVVFIANCSKSPDEDLGFLSNIATWLTAGNDQRASTSLETAASFDQYLAVDQREERFGGTLQVSWSDVRTNMDDDFGLYPRMVKTSKKKKRSKAASTASGPHAESGFAHFLASQDSRLSSLVRSASTRSAVSSRSSLSSNSENDDDGEDLDGDTEDEDNDGLEVDRRSSRPTKPRRRARRNRRHRGLRRRNTDTSKSSRKERHKREEADMVADDVSHGSKEEVQPTEEEEEIDDSKRAFGSGTERCDAETALEDASRINCYGEIPGSNFRLRVGPNYKRNKLKAEAGPAIYELVSMDLASTERKVFHLAERLALPKIPKSSVENRSGLPEVLIVNYQAPMYEPALLGRDKTDGKSSGMGGVFRLSDWARDNPEHVSVEMFRRFVNCFDGDPYRERLKCVASIVNPDQMGFSRVERAMFNRYNATPWMVRPEYRFFQGQGYFEIDVDIHIFNKFSRKLGWTVTKRLAQAVIDGALVVQAESDEEMPELPICCWRMARFQLTEPPCQDPVDTEVSQTTTFAKETMSAPPTSARVATEELL
ncbi:CRAL-TRIO domain-containing protein C589.09, mitochondrial [Hondaea fermentalgiana]|uniref:CRAL-TRIO domain-containing protein C589.09, mitochondrial n=1 Tax=Hondaea fermentalgiana TaxID=2315210 RepID=A0A2R5GR45_9STRA|nr:CRAL-TRIO domain-containing protein C589.09, mitochondrial [Hondaea fermentalgiana]|eukprot:GBG33356.1 CRAL-TRIO domain-containing protein C589.09, mitochondrial [Hondaea fermentalgiana]